MDDGMVLHFGSAVKAFGGGKIGGYLALFSTADDPDLEGDYFTKSTDFFLDEENPRAFVLYDHALDPTVKRTKLGHGTLKVDDVGLWIEAQMTRRAEYKERVDAIYAMAEKGALGWSSGSAPHLVERVKVGKSFEIKSWPIVEASLTPCPMEPRASAFTLKSYQAEKAAGDILEPRPGLTSTVEDEAPAAKSFIEHSEAVLAANAELILRAKSIQELRLKSGRVFKNFEPIRVALEAQLTTLRALLDEALPAGEEHPKSASPDLIYGLLAEFQQHKFRATRAA